MALVRGAAVAGFVAVLLGVGTLTSLKQVDQNQYGLVVNWITKKIGSQVYHGGLHCVGFWNTFVNFPATVQTIEFSERKGLHTTGALHTRTKEGLSLHLSIAFQYKLHPDGLPALYALTNMQYEALFVRIARDQLLEVASDYEGPQYWRQRKEIGDKMRDQVDTHIKGSHASLWDLELLRIDLPKQYEDSITQTQVQQQMIKTRTNEQVAAGIRADTDIMRAEYQRKIRVVEAGAEANYTLVTRLAEGKAAKRKVTAEAQALGYVRQKLALSTAGAVEYQQLGAYARLENATILANVLGVEPVLSAGAVAGRKAGLLQTSEAVAPPAAAPQLGSSPPPVEEEEASTAAGRNATELHSKRRPRLRASILSVGHSMLQVVCRLN
uniref:Band 7 domain-containing protein n=2 Tax=Alexandrium catenella TaxID=2925 RepID=A0A7S1MB42_ALECA|mmetsp:Transcript_23475/g.63868  ORF Transcript_23475/g.63868 Transcript_23475/m.63868 type:complete len:382 (+) Transcript_23475:80-1225(+)